MRSRRRCCPDEQLPDSREINAVADVDESGSRQPDLCLRAVEAVTENGPGSLYAVKWARGLQPRQPE